MIQAIYIRLDISSGWLLSNGPLTLLFSPKTHTVRPKLHLSKEVKIIDKDLWNEVSTLCLSNSTK